MSFSKTFTVININIQKGQTSTIQMKRKSSFHKVILSQKKTYNCFSKIFCCKCIYCCQDFDFSLLTSEHRRDAFQKMVNKYLKHLNKEKDQVVDPYFILMALLLGKNTDIYNQLLIQINQQRQHNAIFSKEDLQFYIPQLCTYLVFHQQMGNQQLFNLMQRACKLDLHVSFRYYFYLRALQSNNGHSYAIVNKYNGKFRQKINAVYHDKICQQMISDEVIEQYNSRSPTSRRVQYPKLNELIVNKMYQPILIENKQTGLFQSTVCFFDELIQLSRTLIKKTNRKQYLYDFLRKMNKRLPACVSVPFSSENYQNFFVAGIIYEQCKVFNSKQRAPFQICLQIYYNPTRQKLRSDSKIKSVSRVYRSMHRTNFFEQDNIQTQQVQQQIEQKKIEQKPKKKNEMSMETSNNFSRLHNLQQKQKNKKSLWDKIFQLKNFNREALTQQQLHSQIQVQKKQDIQQDDSVFLFGQTKAQQFERISKISPFSQLPSYSLIHLIVKSHDDLKQEAFAMQLLQQFKKIFKLQNIPIKLTPYQVVPIFQDAGIIQCVKDAITISQLRKKDSSLEVILKDQQKLKNFISSLAGYSLITYLLQVKDRHNGNIMINKDGSIFHIDFGFFISNNPGKGVQLEKNIPFKLTNEYVYAMGGLKSKHFNEFRKLFYRGYNACRKHQHRILILAKLMYSCFGKTMSCFCKGDEAIEKLQQRFNPIGIRNDVDLSLFCNTLINCSVDNWRARWYDKWQYYMQGILY